MLAQLAAEAVLALHFAFLLFAVLGGLAVPWRAWVAWLHVPALVWGTVVSLMGWVCPLTPLENHFRRLAGQSGYGGSFLEQYVTPIVYPSGMTRGVQVFLGVALLSWNVAIYGFVWRRRRSPRQDRPRGAR